jgi:hypothetical protein
MNNLLPQAITIVISGIVGVIANVIYQKILQRQAGADKSREERARRFIGWPQQYLLVRLIWMAQWQMFAAFLTIIAFIMLSSLVVEGAIMHLHDVFFLGLIGLGTALFTTGFGLTWYVRDEFDALNHASFDARAAAIEESARQK